MCLWESGVITVADICRAVPDFCEFDEKGPNPSSTVEGRFLLRFLNFITPKVNIISTATPTTMPMMPGVPKGELEGWSVRLRAEYPGPTSIKFFE